MSTILLAELRKEGRLNFKHVVVDSSSVHAPGGGLETGPNPTDRRKTGTKHSSGLGKKQYVVERTIAHLHEFRKLEMREEHTAVTYSVLTKLSFCVKYVMVLIR